MLINLKHNFTLRWSVATTPSPNILIVKKIKALDLLYFKYINISLSVTFYFSQYL